MWTVDQLHVNITRGTGRATVTHGPTTDAPVDMDSTTLAGSNTTGPGEWVLYPAESITIVFSALIPGVTASAILRARQSRYP